MALSAANKNKFTMLGIFLLVIISLLFVWYNKLNLGLDLRGGLRLVVEGKDTPDIKVTSDSINGALEVIRGRIDALGVAEPVIQRKGERQIEIELPGIKDQQRAIAMIGETAVLEFKEAEWAPGDMSLLSPAERKQFLGTDGKVASVNYYDNAGNVISTKEIILHKTVLTGSDLKWAGPGTNEYGQPNVSLEFTPEGGRKFYNVTLRSVGKPIAILLDGRIISAPNVNEAISGGRAQITGKFSVKEVQDLVIKLKAGSLPIPVEIVENKIIGPTLGEDSIKKSKQAALIGFALVALFMLLYYRINGLVAVVGLAMYCAFYLAVFSLMNVTLTLPGIAGFILSIGMAVDANVLIFERLKEELKTGRTIHNAIDVAFQRAWLTIFDSNITTIFGIIGIFIWGSGSIKGFAWALTIGILVSMFTAVTITKHIMLNIYGLTILKKSAEKIG